MCYHCTLDWSKQALNTLLSGLRHTGGEVGGGGVQRMWRQRNQSAWLRTERIGREREGERPCGWKEPIQSDHMMMACVVITFLYEGPQEIGEPVDIQLNQYQRALVHSSSLLKSCRLVMIIFVNNIRGGIHQRKAPVLKIYTPLINSKPSVKSVERVFNYNHAPTLLCACSAHFLSTVVEMRESLLE